jgi:hypothetical protein
MLLAGGMTEKEIESLRQIWLAQFTLFISCWTVQPHERLVCLRKQHQLAFPRPQYEDGPTRSRFFLNQLDVSGVNSFVSGVNSFVLSVYQAARHCSPLPWWWWPRVCLCWTICSNAFLGLRLLTDRAFPVLFFAAVHLFSRSSCFCVAEQPNHLAEGLKIVNLT